MVQACGPTATVDDNPGAALGVILGTAAVNGRERSPYHVPRHFRSRRVARTVDRRVDRKKSAKASSPSMRTPRRSDAYGNDVSSSTSPRLRTGHRAGFQSRCHRKGRHPVIRIAMSDIYELGAEFFRWRSPLPSPAPSSASTPSSARCRSSKIATKSLTSEYEAKGSLPAEKPVVEDRHQTLHRRN